MEHSIILSRSFATHEEAGLRLLTQGSDLIDELEFTPIHEAVLALSSISLKDALLQHPYVVNVKDRSGRTALAWAAASGNDEAVELLLTHGSDPNTIDAHGTTPFYNVGDATFLSVQAAYTKCCHLLLGADAMPDPPKPPGRKASTPLIAVCIAGANRDIFKALTDFGADLNNCAFDGRASLHHTARRDDYELMTMLLDAGASIKIESRYGETPLSLAITHNSHRALHLLLERWSEYSECPRLKGPNLLLLTATFADVETIDLLTATDHLRLEYDVKYSLDDHMKILRARSDADEKLIEAFQRLLAVINEQVSSLHESLESLMEAGHPPRRRATSDSDSACLFPGSWPNEDEKVVDDSSEDSDKAFEQALSTILSKDS
jgi:ankyrin repeat protein